MQLAESSEQRFCYRGHWQPSHWSRHPGGDCHNIGERKMSDYQTTERKLMTPAEREARKVFAAAEAKKALSEHEKTQKAFHENRERLKAERLAREAEAANKLSQ
jgi:hypothetical protein